MKSLTDPQKVPYHQACSFHKLYMEIWSPACLFALQVLWEALQVFFMRLSCCSRHHGVIPLPENWLNLSMPAPSGISGLGTQHPLHSPHGHSLLVVSESRHARNRTVNSREHRWISYSILAFSATRSALPGLFAPAGGTAQGG